MKIILFIIFFLLIGAFFIISNENLRMNKVENIDIFIRLYGGWLDSVSKNARGMSGYVVKMEWLPNNGEVG